MALINFSGIASGIDTEALIKATSDATRQTRQKPLQDTVTELTDTNDALSTLKTKLGTLKTALSAMATLSGGALVKQVSSSSETLVTASAVNGASNGTYTVHLPTTAKAVNGVQALYDVGGNDWTSLTSVVTAGATLSAAPANQIVVTVGGETVTLDVTGATTISDLVTSFNSQSTTGVMSAVNIGTTASPQYRLMVSALSTGAVEGAVSITPGGDFATFLDTTTAQAGVDASFDVTGVATGIGRSTNTVSDVIPGVNFTILSNPSVATDVTLTITDDVTATTSKVQDFVDAWNDIVKYIKDKNLVTRQESNSNVTNIFGPLSKTSVDNDSLSSLRSALAAADVPTGTYVRIMADLGITTQQDGTLKFDTKVFAESLAKEPNSVNTLLMDFADTTSLTGGTIDQYTGFNRMFDVVSQGNDTRISDLNKRIAEIESQIAKTEQSMRSRYAALEKSMGQLQSQQSQLTSSLSALK